MIFEPIAITGQSCLLPGALNPQELVKLVLEGKDALSKVPDGYWRTDPAYVMASSPKNAADQTWSDRGGYVRGFESVFDPAGFALPADEILQYDIMVQWLLHTAREALRDAGCLNSKLKTGIIFGNLSYPSHSLTQFAEAVWLDSQDKNFLGGKAREKAGVKRPHPKNRYMSGLPAHITARALNLEGGAFALDAACASSLYAVKLACDKLHDREADVMLAGGVNRADDLIIHIGFCVLQAMSHTGRSRPFHKNADGLVPAEGAGFVALKRLDDAVKAGDRIYGVIRGVGLSNDGRGHGLLVPFEDGQFSAMQKAYEMSGISPAEISLLECHATGTMVGDAIELRSMKRIFKGLSDIPIGTVKSNMGHPITVSGIAGLLKVLGAMKEKIRPKTLHAEIPLDEIINSPFRLLNEAEAWDAQSPRKAAISNFGFGGNNAHIIIEEWDEKSHGKQEKKQRKQKNDEIAIVGIGAIVADAIGKDEFAAALFSGNSRVRNMDGLTSAAFTESIELPLMGLNFPPADLEQTLPQQLIILKTALEAVSGVKNLPNERTCLFAGMQCDAEVSRGALGWKLKQLAVNWTGKTGSAGIDDWIKKARSYVNPFGKAPAVLGAMPNIVANRISSQLNIKGPAFSVSSEELSGIRALNLAIRALREREMDAAVVGAVDICCEQVNETAAAEVLPAGKRVPGDAAVTLVLKRLEDAVKDNDKIYAIISADNNIKPRAVLGSKENEINLEPQFGHSHAASGLVYVAGAALACYYRTLPAGKGQKAVPWLRDSGALAVDVSIDSLGGESGNVRISSMDNSFPDQLFYQKNPAIYIYSGKDRREVLQSMDSDKESNVGPCRLVIASTPGSLAEMKAQAKAVIEKGAFKDHIELGKGIFYREKPLSGETAFVFTGSAGVYPGIGREILMAFPDFIDEIKRRFNSLTPIPDYIFNRDPGYSPTPEDMLWSSTFLSQVHAEISRNIMGLKPDAAIGFSSGETNSLFAMGAWNDIDAMAREFRDSGVFTRHLGGEFDAVKKAWKDHKVKNIKWANWQIRASMDEISKAIDREPLVHVIIINSPADIVIGGQEEACGRIIEKLGRNRAFRLPYNVASHCPEIGAYADEWLKLHRRETAPVPGVRFYTSSTCSHYHPDSMSAAKALLGMAVNTVDFPRMIENGWNDGIRIFIEHGPRDSCTRWIRDILGDKEFVAVPLDIGGKSSIIQLIHAAGQLIAAGVPVDLGTLKKRNIITDKKTDAAKEKAASPKNVMKTYLIHPPRVQFPPLEFGTESPAGAKTNQTQAKGDFMKTAYPIAGETPQIMAPAPMLPPVTGEAEAIAERYHSNGFSPEQIEMNRETIPDSVGTRPDLARHQNYSNAAGYGMFGAIIENNTKILNAHTGFLQQTNIAHQKFMELRNSAVSIMMNAMRNAGPGFSENIIYDNYDNIIYADAGVHVPVYYDKPAAAEVKPQPAQQARPAEKKPVQEAKPATADKAQKPAAKTKPAPASGKEITAEEALMKQFENPVEIQPKGPSFSREQLKILASGKISEVFGPMFAQQDGYKFQVRLPEEPLLLADRITGIDAEPGSMGKGIMWTETDVTPGSWYLQDIYMPAGVTIESGQCDLTLISYLGIDFLNKGSRVYRLLGCDLMYHGRPPKIGDTLRYQIHIDGHANIGDTRIFFFRYDCRIKNELILSVRNAQAGFFTYEQLSQSGGVLWEPETGEHKPDGEARVDKPLVKCKHRKFSKEQVLAFSEGRAYDCFGEGFEIMASHTKSPKLPSGMMLLIQEVAEFDPEGGPWKRGYIRVENDIHADDWYLPGHFKNDPCMPGTLMSDACMQTLGFYVAAMGYTIHKDGWRLDPVKNQVFQAKCRGQVSTTSKKLIYEAYIEEFISEPYPTVYADLLATVDGLKCLHIKRLGIRLVPDFPLDCWPHLLEGHVEKKPAAKYEGFEFGYHSLMACAFGKPSDAFGRLGKHFDDGRHIARLPGPPYHFMTRVTEINAKMAAMISKGENITVEYDVPSDAWYFDKNGYPTMPFCVLMEVALQPCGWLAVFEGGVAVSMEPLLFRNLDGTGIQHVEIMPETGTIKTHTRLTNIAQLKGVALFNFDVECFVDDTLVYTMKTGFGFFLRSAFDQQFGIPMNDAEKKKASDEISKPSGFMVDLTDRPARYCGGLLRMPDEMLLMLDRVTGYWPEDGGKGRLRAEKDVNIKEWFFKAHFFHDPVQPGSLGVEAIIQLLQFFMIHNDMGKGIKNPRFEPLWIGKPITWKYRGQVTPKNKMITSELIIQETGIDEKGPYAVAEGSLWVDGLKIYHVKDIGMRIVPGGEAGKRKQSPGPKSEKNAPDRTADKQLIDNIAGELEMSSSAIHIAEDKKTFRCDNMPLNIFPLEIIKKRDSAETAKIGQSYFDWDSLIKYGRELLGHSPCIIEDISRELCTRFVNNLIVEDPAKFDSIRHRNLLYLGNHQVQIESMLFTGLAHYLNDALTVAVSDAIHRTSWMGRLNNIAYEYPVVEYARNMHFFDQSDRESMFDIIKNFKKRIVDEGISVLVHIEGKLGLTCRKPVATLSSVFIDMALDCNLPIIPLRFTGGLPVEPMKSTRDFPVGYCRQNIYFGKPIFPEELVKIPYAGRRKFVMNAINSLGISNEAETPFAPDPEFKKDVEEWMKLKKVTEVQAVFYKAMENSAHTLSEESLAMIRFARKGEKIDTGDEIGRWLEKFSRWLLG